MALRSLQSRLIFYFLLPGILFIFLVGIFAFFAARKALVDRTFDQLLSLHEVNRKQISNYLDERKSDIYHFSQSNKLRTYSAGSVTDTQLFFLNALNDFNITHKHYDCVIIYDTAGKKLFFHEFDTPGTYVFHEECEMDRDIGKIITNQRVFLEETPDSTKIDSNLYIISPVYFAEAEKGVMFVSLKKNVLYSLNPVNALAYGMGQTGESYLVGPDYYLRSPSRFESYQPYQTLVKNEATINAIEGSHGKGLVTDYRSEKVYSVYGPLGDMDLGWALLTEINETEAMIPISRMRNQVILLSLLAAMVFGVLGFMLSMKIQKQIRKLKVVANRVSEGEFTTIEESNSVDEIGSLSEAFDTMVIQMQQQTQELSEREQRLQHFNDATLDGIALHADGKPLQINQGFANMTGFSQKELESSNIHEIVTLKEWDEKGDESISYESVAKRKDGTTFPVDIQESYVQYNEEYVRATVIRDISERKTIEKELKKARRARMSSLIDGQELERQRLSREIHDGLGQSLIGIKFKLESAMHTDMSKIRYTINSAREMFDDLIDEIRRMSNDLMPAVLNEFGLVRALHILTEEASRHGKIKINVSIDAEPPKSDERMNTYLYRIAQEGISNIIKHSEASEANISLFNEDNKLILLIEDNGIGISSPGGGNGLNNMRERAIILRAKLKIDTADNQGCRIRISIPLDEV